VRVQQIKNTQISAQLQVLRRDIYRAKELAFSEKGNIFGHMNERNHAFAEQAGNGREASKTCEFAAKVSNTLRIPYRYITTKSNRSMDLYENTRRL
jgi:hypothetical protein